MRLIVLVILISFCSSSFSQNKEVCFTFDDLPVATISFKSIPFQKMVLNKLLLALNKHKIPAIGFVNEKKLYSNNQLDTQKVNLVKLWLNAGMDIGNHSFSHFDYHKTSSKKYFDDIIKGEIITKKLMAEFGRSPKYFRHPFLHVGETKERADSLHTCLKNSGYEEAPVTIDNSDWIFSLAYDSAMVKKDTLLMKKIGVTYINYMEMKLKYFENQALKLFGRNIKQILLLHSNGINADYLDDLAAMYIKNNYEFIQLKNALSDEAYLTNITVYRN
ncbi:MAG: polysaccharide deacetylase family protein [Ignavibacteriales bacterium]|nr:polysaccharide deacetylase family protein [Ignavibacteriales bacterium]